MNTTRVMSLVAATVFAVGIVGPAVAQTPAPAPATKSGDMQDMKDSKDKDTTKKKASTKHTTKKSTTKKDEQTSSSGGTGTGSTGTGSDQSKK